MLSETEYNFGVDFEIDFSSIQSDVDAYCDTLAEDTTFIVDLNYKLDNKVKDISLNQDIKLFINDKVDFELGWESKYLKMNYAEQFAGQQTYQNNENPIINSAYIKNLYKPIPVLSFDLGLRVSKSSYYDKTLFDPRVGLKYMATSDLALKFMWGKFTQFMFTINQDEELLRLVDFWQAIGKGQLPQSNDHYVFGLEYWISNGNTFSFETYYKPYSRLYDLSVVVSDITDESSYFTAGKGHNWGLELLYQFNKNKINGWIGYSYSFINREIDLNRDGVIQSNSENYPSNYSKPHTLNFVFNYKLSEKNNTFLGLTSVISSGAPYTPVVGKSFYASAEQYGSLEQPYAYLSNIYGSRNSARYPLYFRTDISYTRDGKILTKPVEWKFQIINLTNNFNSFLFIDPIKGFGNKIETDIIDLFENHKLYSNAFIPFSNLKSPDIFIEYSYLKRRNDFKLGFKRKLIFLENDEDYLYHKYQYNSVYFVSSYPISKFSRIEISPEYKYSQFNDLDYRVLNTTPIPHLTESKFNYIGIKTRIIFDNTKKIAMNLQQGTKLKFGFENYNSLKSTQNNFNKFYFDINHYQKIHKEITLASKLYYGNFFGNNPKYFLLGGVKNSLFSKKEENAKYDPLSISSGIDNSNVLFTEFHNLRGYNYNKFQGNQILKFTTELRVPIIKYLLNREVSSSFVQNLQLISFFDVGSSWTGKSPFNTDNSINIWVINDPGSVFDAEVVNSKNPWLSSFGWGIQSLIMDYYVKIDFAKPIEDYKVGKPKLHFSIGYSF